MSQPDPATPAPEAASNAPGLPVRRAAGGLGPVVSTLGSLRLTVVLLSISILLVFLGTLDQVQFGIRQVQEKYFESFLVVWGWPASWVGGSFLQYLKIPLPGGYVVGPLLVVNLVAAHFRYFKASWNKAGIVLVHLGVVLLLVSQLVTQLVQDEFYLWLDEGTRRSYIESFTDDELVLIDRTDPAKDLVVAIPTSALVAGTEIRHPAMPFTVKPVQFHQNAGLLRRQGENDPRPVAGDRGIAVSMNLAIEGRPRVSKDNERDITSAVVALEAGGQPLGTWLVSNVFDERFPTQTFTHAGREWEIALRIRREYLPFQVELVDFTHEKYPGTEIPRVFSSKVIVHEEGRPAHPVLISMNEPLRAAGKTFYQASFGKGDTASMLQVVRNPGWFGPYVACTLMTLGMVLQFGLSLRRFLGRRASASTPSATA